MFTMASMTFLMAHIVRLWESCIDTMPWIRDADMVSRTLSRADGSSNCLRN